MFERRRLDRERNSLSAALFQKRIAAANDYADELPAPKEGPMSLWDHLPYKDVQAVGDHWIARTVCHVLDADDEALCFADLRGRPVHPIELCRAEGHSVCATCDELRAELDGWEER
jgi:hypothetical protein